MQLYRIVVEHKDIQAHKEWEDRMMAWRGKELFNEPYPPPLRRVHYVAVYGAYGNDMIARATNIALESVVGEQQSWLRWEASIIEVTFVGVVSVEREDAPSHESAPGDATGTG